jgi:hypothetical protein
MEASVWELPLHCTIRRGEKAAMHTSLDKVPGDFPSDSEVDFFVERGSGESPRREVINTSRAG